MVRYVRPESDAAPADLAAACRELRTRWQADRPLAAYVEVPGPAAEPWRLVAADLGIPLLATWHPLSWMAPASERDVLDRALRAFLGQCQQVLAETPTIRRQLAREGLLATSLVVNGVDGMRFHPRLRSDALRAAWGASATTPVILHVGRLEVAKGSDLLAATYAALAAAQPQARLVCIGAGTAQAALQAAVPSLICPGFLEGEALAVAYASADIFLFPSLGDPYGNVTLEAAASGLAVVSFARAAAGEHLVEAAELVPPDGPDPAAAFIAAALALAADPARQETFRTAGRAAVERCRWADTARAFLAAVERAQRQPPRLPVPGLIPVSATVRAPLPEPTDLAGHLIAHLAARGHALAWDDTADVRELVCDHRTLALSGLAADLPVGAPLNPWARPVEIAEGRLCAWAAGNPWPTRPLRICAALRAPRTVGGASRRFHHLLAGLRRLGHAVQVQAETPLAEPPPTPSDPAEQAARHARLLRGLAARWQDDRPDVVHVEILDSFGATVAEAAQRHGIPWTMTWHPLADHVPAAQTASVANTLRALASSAARIFAETAHDAATLHAAGLPRATVVGNGVDLVRYAPSHHDPTLRASWNCTIAVLVVGRLLAAKNVAVLPAVAAALRAIPGARLIIAGDGPEGPALRAAIPNALWLGAVADRDLPRIYASADLFLFTSRVDSWGLVVAEALASGLPVIGHDRAAVAELVTDGVNGWKVPLSGDLTEVTAAAAALPLTEVEREQRRAAARAAAPAWDHVVRTLATELAGIDPLRP